jgi:NAD(P)H-hydrate epimerase
MPTPTTPRTPAPGASLGETPLPADDPTLFDLDLRGLRARWAATAALPPISAEAMMGADHKAQALGTPAEFLMEHAGAATAAAAHALAVDTERWGRGPIVILAGPGNNGGDGFVAARRLARAGAHVVVAFIASEGRPRGREAAKNWDRLVNEERVTLIHAPVARDVAILGQGIEKASIVVDALLGTGVVGVLREPIRSAVDLVNRARASMVPVLAGDTPTAVDLSSGQPSDPAVRADLTITFHRPKTGLRTKMGAALAGRVLVAPIGIPPAADRA